MREERAGLPLSNGTSLDLIRQILQGEKKPQSTSLPYLLANLQKRLAFQESSYREGSVLIDREQPRYIAPSGSNLSYGVMNHGPFSTFIAV